MARVDRVFLAALGFSLVFHLSMVTLFSIVILFPREDIEYYRFEIVNPQTLRPIVPTPGDTLRVPTVSDPFASAPEPVWANVPQIELPTLEIAGLQRLSAREDSLQIRSKYEDILDTGPKDPWARFGRELGQLGTMLSRVAFLEPSEEPEMKPPEPVGHPAPGFETYLEWMSEPKNRQLLFAPPILALRTAAPEQLKEPIVLGFRVNPQGR
ncbi:MAG: hypothetical protein HY706_16670, partial [Candidatus Hydrogenedentes bacterium]|nr:hypothetical protein [Candidatus Hydrogenedentota bacterium]